MSDEVGPRSVVVIGHQVDRVQYLAELTPWCNPCNGRPHAHCNGELLVGIRKSVVQSRSHLAQKHEIVLPI
eukprot:scaffold3635_cov31-Tisochrysis_lutea.AAC.1